MTKVAVAATFALAVAAPLAHAAPDQLMACAVVLVKPHGAAKFVCRGTFTLPSPAEDPTVGGARILVEDRARPGGNAINLGSAGWMGLGRPPGSKGFRYHDTLFCPTVIVKPSVVKGVCTGLGYVSLPLVGPAGVSLEMPANAPRRRYCAEAGGGSVIRNDASVFRARQTSPPSLCPSSVKNVFVTSTTYEGNLGGLAGADATCNAVASGAGLPGVYRAWLSDSTASPSTRFTQSPIYELPNGLDISNSGWPDLTDGTLYTPIDVSELGTTVGNVPVWTNTMADGTSDEYSCANWTSASSGDLGSEGFSGQTDYAWSDGDYASCDHRVSLYCFEQ